MFPIFRERTAYGRAVRSASDGLIAAHGQVADLEAGRAARMPGLTKSERTFCEEVAMRVSRELGVAPTTSHRAQPTA